MRRILFFCFIFFINVALAEVHLKEMSGQVTPFSSLEGKWVIINYWASWCKSCIAEIPFLNHFYKTHKNISLYAVNYDYLPPEGQKKLIKKYNIQYPSLAEDPAYDLNLGEINGVPVTFIFNPEGQLVDTLYGVQTMNSLSKVIH